MSTSPPLTAAEKRWHAKARVIKYRRPWLYREQEDFLFTRARYSIVEATTKSGKTTGCIVWLNEKACLEGHVGWNGWWVAPIRAQAKIAYDRLKRFTGKFGALLKFNDTELSVLYPNGAKLWFKSADNPDSLYGDDVYAVVFDEATRAKEPAWYAVRSTLTFTEGPARIIGNVRGRKNWAFKLARLAQAGEPDFYYAKLTAWHAVAAGILSRKEVEDAQRILPPDVFAELYLAEPSEDGSNPFGIANIRACIMPTLAGGPSVAHGVDLAKSIDWCVDIGLNAAKETAFYDRWQGPWEATVPRIKTNVGKVLATIDATGVGDSVFEQLAKGRDNYTAFKFTRPSKQSLMEGLALAIGEGARDGRRWIYAGPNDVMLNELEAMEYVYDARGGLTYEVPAGMHDDTVMALALAVEQYRHRATRPTRGARSVSY